MRAIAITLVALVFPASAFADPSTVRSSGYGDLSVSVSGAEPHSIVVSYGAGGYEVTDSAGIAVSDPEFSTCASTGPDTARCADRPPNPELGLGEVSVFVEGGMGNDTITFASIAPAAHSVVHAFAGNDRIVGSDKDDLVYGYKGDDTLIGNGGDDSLFGGPGGQDTGADTFDGGPGADYVNGESSEGGYSVDTVSYAESTGPVKVTPGFGDGDDGGAADGPPGQRDTVEYVENVVGGGGNDVIVAVGRTEATDHLDNVFFGGAGADRLLGGGGPDRLIGGPGADSLLGQGSKDALLAHDGARDKRIDCGPGTGKKERASRDRVDPVAISC